VKVAFGSDNFPHNFDWHCIYHRDNLWNNTDLQKVITKIYPEIIDSIVSGYISGVPGIALPYTIDMLTDCRELLVSGPSGIQDSSMTASSYNAYTVSAQHAPYHARLNNTPDTTCYRFAYSCLSVACWQSGNNEQGEWIQVRISAGLHPRTLTLKCVRPEISYVQVCISLLQDSLWQYALNIT
jgi:hypothetical protein